MDHFRNQPDLTTCCRKHWHSPSYLSDTVSQAGGDVGQEREGQGGGSLGHIVRHTNKQNLSGSAEIVIMTHKQTKKRMSFILLTSHIGVVSTPIREVK